MAIKLAESKVRLASETQWGRHIVYLHIIEIKLASCAMVPIPIIVIKAESVSLPISVPQRVIIVFAMHPYALDARKWYSFCGPAGDASLEIACRRYLELREVTVNEQILSSIHKRATRLHKYGYLQ